MATYVANDLHGAETLIRKVVRAIERMKSGDILIINGDGAGARGPRMTDLVSTFYKVRRGETSVGRLRTAVSEIIEDSATFPQSWVYGTVHAGLFRKLLADKYPKFSQVLHDELEEILKGTLVPISQAATKAGVKIIYLPGNGEVTPDDFSTEDISIEKAVPPAERYYQKLAERGAFREYGIEYVQYVKMIGHTCLISSNLLDLPAEDAKDIFANAIGKSTIDTIVVHYPATASVGRAFAFWTPNKVDVQRIDALAALLDQIDCLADNAKIIFGHIHLSGEENMSSYPDFMGFESPRVTSVWVKPGVVMKI